jgi:hypothetical protein
MSHRSRGGRRRGRSSDPLETVKPLVVLGLLGMIVYGAATMVRSGRQGAGQATDQVQGLVPAAVEMPTDPPPAPVFASAPVTAPPIAPPPVAPPEAPVTPTPALTPAPALATTPPASRAQPPVGEPAATYLPAQVAAAPVPDSAPPAALAPAAGPTATPLQSAAATAVVSAAAGPAVTPAPDATAILPAGRQALPSAPGSAAFAAAWADAHQKLSAGQYAEALSVLSVWYDDPSLGPEESQRLDELLGQLAGTVIYSQQDLLMPAHVVTAGQTLQSLAVPLQVPWQLLAKINGISDPSQLIPGEHLKLVRGPVDAIISVSRRRLSLQVAGHYAGSFPVVLGRGVADRIGSSVAVIDVRPAGLSTDHASGPRRSLVLADGLAIEAVDDPATLTDAAVGSTVLVAIRDFADLVDILGPGSHVLVRR